MVTDPLSSPFTIDLSIFVYNMLSTLRAGVMHHTEPLPVSTV